MWSNVRLLLVCALAVTAQNLLTVEKDFVEKDAISDLLNKTLDQLRPYLTELTVPRFDIKTGRQEFGDFSGTLIDAHLTGLGDFVATIIQIGLIPPTLKNVTIVVNKAVLIANYDLEGLLAFPLLKNDLHVYGLGLANLTVNNAVASVKASLTYDQDHNIVINPDTFELLVNIEEIVVNLDNLMSGGALQVTINQLLTDIAATVVDYYKAGFIEAFKPVIIEVMNQVLQQVFHH